MYKKIFTNSLKYIACVSFNDISLHQNNKYNCITYSQYNFQVSQHKKEVLSSILRSL